MIRYKNAYKNAPLIYLTLQGVIPSDGSKGELKEGQDYICLSYKKNIVAWIEACIKEMANKPIIRETLNQYLILIKQLTNQSTNNSMKNEIMNIIFKNEENVNAFIEMQKFSTDFYKHIIKNFLIPSIENVALSLNLNVFYNESPLINQNGWPGFYFDNDRLKRVNIKIQISANRSTAFSDIIFGIVSDVTKFNFKTIQDKYKNIYPNNPKNHWKCKTDYTYYKDFNDLKTLKKIYSGDFEKDLFQKVKNIYQIINESLIES